MPDLSIELASIPCFDPGCAGRAVPEEDGQMRWYDCETCGYEFGYEEIPQEPGSCSLGVPEQVRARQPVPAGGEVFLGQIGRRPK